MFIVLVAKHLLLTATKGTKKERNRYLKNYLQWGKKLLNDNNRNHRTNGSEECKDEADYHAGSNSRVKDSGKRWEST